MSVRERYRRALTIAGASLILITFIVKDAYREHAKDTSDALEAEYYHFELRFDIYQIEQRLKGFSPDLFDGVEPKTLEEALTMYDAALEKTRSFLDGGLGMTVTLLSDDDKVKEIFDYGFSESDYDARLEEISQERQNIQDQTQLFSCVVKQINEVRAVGSMVALAVEKAHDEKLKEIKARKISSEKIYRKWTYGSYVLFLIGWLMTLWGKLAGVPVLSAEG